MQRTLLSLYEVKSHFQHWRATRIKRSKIPVYLWELVKQLIGHYSLTIITKALNINSNQIRDNINLDDTINFVEVGPNIKPLEPDQLSSAIDDARSCAIELHRTNGGILKISRLPVSSLSVIITQFMA
jgi:hypothetical protein